MGFLMAYAACFACKQPFSFNPHCVPSIRGASGEKEPVCGQCMEQANERRVARGEQPHPIHPEAYAPLDENAL
jgi:hypothetical protein